MSYIVGRASLQLCFNPSTRQIAVRTVVSFTILSTSLSLFEGRDEYIGSELQERPSPIASKAEDERSSTARRYFWATCRSAGWIKSHQRRIDSCTSASDFSPTTSA